MWNLLHKRRVRPAKLPQIIGGSHELCERAVDNRDHEALLVSAGLRTTFNDSLQTRSALSQPMCLVPINEESQADGFGLSAWAPVLPACSCSLRWHLSTT